MQFFFVYGGNSRLFGGAWGVSFGWTVAQPQQPASLDRSSDPVQLERSLLEEEARSLAVSAKEQGDARRGASFFFSSRTGCAQCHWSPPKSFGPGSKNVESETKGMQSIGPDLADWKRVVRDSELVDSVLRPSRFIHQDYRAMTIVTDSGES